MGFFFLRKVYLYGVELPRLGHTMFLVKTRLGFPSVVEYSIRHDKRACDQHHNQFLHGLDQGTGAQVRGLLHGLVHAADTGRDSVAGVLSANSAFNAKMLSVTAGLGCVIMSVPSVLIGAVAANTGGWGYGGIFYT